MTPATAGAVTAMMVEIVERGTATEAQIDGVAGRGQDRYRADRIDGQAPHAWFVAFAPADNPRFAVSVIVENGGNYGDDATGGVVAAPIARQMLADIARPAMTASAEPSRLDCR